MLLENVWSETVVCAHLQAWLTFLELLKTPEDTACPVDYVPVVSLAVPALLSLSNPFPLDVTVL